MTGGLGNRLFQIFAGIGYAERCRKRFVFYEEQMSHNPHSNPKTTKQLLLALFPTVQVYRGAAHWSNYVEPVGTHYEYTEIPNYDGSVMLSGFFQNTAYFPLQAREKFIIPRPRDLFVDCSGINFEHAYFVHFRFGDYVNSEFDIDFDSYYASCISRLRSIDPIAELLLFSDQPAKIPEKISGRVIQTGLWETLWLMSRCQGGICANSTFSWFGAFSCRGAGPIFMPTLWSKRNSANPNPTWAISS
jgi:hypothetical protein